MKSPFDALEAAYAYDMGATDSGFRDEVRIAASIRTLAAMDYLERRSAIAKWVIEAFLSDEALRLGYGPEDARDFIEWLSKEAG